MMFQYFQKNYPLNYNGKRRLSFKKYELRYKQNSPNIEQKIKKLEFKPHKKIMIQ